MTHGIRCEKNRHEVAAYATVQTGLDSKSCIPMVHQNHPKYAGWRKYLARAARIMWPQSVIKLVGSCAHLYMPWVTSWCSSRRSGQRPRGSVNSDGASEITRGAYVPVSMIWEKLEPAVRKATIRTPCPNVTTPSPK